MTLKIPIIEHFYAIQGEGKEAGVATYFIRVGGCQMLPKCDFCDSAYSWKEKGLDYTSSQLEKMIRKNKFKHITLTGGEPTLYDKELGRIISLTPNTHYSLETNGLVTTEVDYNNIAVSPKKQHINAETLHTYNQMDNAFFKFVYERGDDKWWEEVIKQLDIDRRKVWIMPEGQTRLEQITKMTEVINYCTNTGFNFSPRLHVLAFDTKRGV